MNNSIVILGSTGSIGVNTLLIAKRYNLSIEAGSIQAELGGRVDIQEKINELTVFKNSLQQLSDSCSGGQKSAVHCSILDTFKH